MTCTMYGVMRLNLIVTDSLCLVLSSVVQRVYGYDRQPKVWRLSSVQ
jgi:hypothetical protein